MADPFTIAVSVAGFASLGLQLADTLNKYAGSAVDSKGRIKAISTDIGLAVQVIRAFDTTIQDEANRAMMNADALDTARDAIAQCQNIFEKIQSTLPELSHAGIKTKVVIMWPFMQPKLQLLRGNLEKVKTTLQLLMNVIIFAAMSKRHVEQVSLDNQRSQIQHLLEEKAKAEARLEVLEREHAAAKRSQEESLLAEMLVPPERNSATTFQPPPLEPGLMINMVGLPPISCLDASPQVNATPLPEEFEITHNIQRRNTIEQTSSSNTVVSQETDADARALQTTYSSDDDSDPEDIMITLHDDYTTCLRQLKALQSSLETALTKMFIPTVGVPMVNLDHDTVARGKMAKKVEMGVRKSYRCFDQRILGPGAHQSVRKEAERRGRAQRCVSRLSRSPFQSSSAVSARRSSTPPAYHQKFKAYSQNPDDAGSHTSSHTSSQAASQAGADDEISFEPSARYHKERRHNWTHPPPPLPHPTQPRLRAYPPSRATMPSSGAPSSVKTTARIAPSVHHSRKTSSPSSKPQFSSAKITQYDTFSMAYHPDDEEHVSARNLPSKPRHIPGGFESDSYPSESPPDSPKYYEQSSRPHPLQRATTSAVQQVHRIGHARSRSDYPAESSYGYRPAYSSDPGWDPYPQRAYYKQPAQPYPLQRASRSSLQQVHVKPVGQSKSEPIHELARHETGVASDVDPDESPLFRSESMSAASSLLPTSGRQLNVDLEDVNDTSPEPFVVDEAGIQARIQRVAARLREDEVVFEGTPPSPSLAQTKSFSPQAPPILSPEESSDCLRQLDAIKETEETDEEDYSHPNRKASKRRESNVGADWNMKEEILPHLDTGDAIPYSLGAGIKATSLDTAKASLPTVEDLLRRWTHLDPNSVDTAADLGN